ncbi:MAG: cupin domain-containing protein [Ignavibacteriaceae bacterium]|nr:cupin domain-containing protein [Ignavibacteriaceae bacterium]
MQNSDAEHYIKELALIQHPEGGFYKEIYRSLEVFTPEDINSERNFMTSIYFLLRAGEFSAFHRLKSDEVWYYHTGASVSIYIIDNEGILKTHILGPEISKGEKLQVIFPKGSWFAAAPLAVKGFSLFGCAVSPGFQFDDFELGTRSILLQKYPQYREIIENFTYC